MCDPFSGSNAVDKRVRLWTENTSKHMFLGTKKATYVTLVVA